LAKDVDGIVMLGEVAAVVAADGIVMPIVACVI